MAEESSGKNIMTDQILESLFENCLVFSLLGRVDALLELVSAWLSFFLLRTIRSEC
jgi:hypothetical protein